MTLQLRKTQLALPWCEVNAFALIPSEITKNERALFSHGYTSQKSDCLPWAVRLAESGVPALIFDWPGHYLGSFNEVEAFSDFANHAHELFAEAWNCLDLMIATRASGVILGGHSLGALMAIKALELPTFASLRRLGIGIGLGLNTSAETHVFDTNFYQKTLNVRRQLVSPALDSDVMFPWIREQKFNLKVKGQRIHLLTGEDDVVVGAGGMEEMRRVLTDAGNTVSTEAPKRLPHHEPGHATAHLYAFLKKELGWH